MQNKLELDIKKYKAFIFDMDGLLLDTERICWQCFIKACSEFNYNPDFKIYKRCIGRKAEEGNLLLKQGFDPFISFDQVKIKWNELYREYIENEKIPLKKGVTGILEFLSDKKHLIAVATSTERAVAQKKLSKTGIAGFFDTIVTGDHVKYSKPDPEIYLLAAKLLKVSPEKCIAFEDSDNGVRSAFEAGMEVVQIVDILEPSDEIKLLGHNIINSFEDLILK